MFKQFIAIIKIIVVFAGGVISINWIKEFCDSDTNNDKSGVCSGATCSMGCVDYYCFSNLGTVYSTKRVEKMKLHQNEFCHNCNQYVDFEFDDTTEKQVIICPNCRHEHWRELDMTTLLNIQLHGHEREICIVDEYEIPPMFNVSDMDKVPETNSDESKSL